MHQVIRVDNWEFEMAEASNAEPKTPAMVERRAAKPLGILPKNTQAMVIAGIAVVMVGAIAFSGPSAPKIAKPALPSRAAVDPNQARIAEYRQRLDEEARKLAAEQAQFLQSKQQFAGAIGSEPGGATAGNGPYPAGHAGENSIENDRRRRAYLSLFASNVALSYRNSNQVSTDQGLASSPNTAPQPQLSTSPVATPYGTFVPFGTSLSGGSSRTSRGNQEGAEGERSDLPTNEYGEPSAMAKNTRDRFVDLNQSEGTPYRLFEGTVLEAVLTNRLNGSFAGPVNCMVTTNVYSHDRRQLLIPQGSRILGEAKRVTTFGHERLAVLFRRLIMPDGYSISLDQFKGLNQIGETGLRDQVNHHYAQIFGASLAIGAIAGLAEADTRTSVFQSSTDTYRQGVANSLAQSSLHILDRYLNVLPNITIREGHRVKIYLSDDLLLPAYQNHRMPEDL
jgi:type IV secretion system protein TrbI